MNAIAKNMTDAAYGQMIALRKQGEPARGCIEMTVDSLMDEFLCSRRRASLLAIRAWYDLEAKGQPAAYVDVSLTTGNTVVVHDQSGRTSVFSVQELMRLRDQAAATTISA